MLPIEKCFFLAGRESREDKGIVRVPEAPHAAGGRVAEKNERDIHGKERGRAAADPDPAALNVVRLGHA